MLAAPKYGFVYLAARKTGSTAIQKAFHRHAQLVTNGPPSLKHVDATEFEQRWAAVLLDHGYPRSDYETVCSVREPVDAVLSWWRYRSRPAIEGRPGYVGDKSFAEFAESIVSGEVRLVTAAEFTVGGVDRVFRHDHVDRLVDWMRNKVGKRVPVEQANVSPPRVAEIPASTRHLLEEFFAADLEIYARAD